MSDSAKKHQENAAARARYEPIRCAVLTVSDSRTPENDRSGDRIVHLLEKNHHVCAARTLIPDDPEKVERSLRLWIDQKDIHAIIITGGTGIGPRDGTIEVVQRLLTRQLDGFGELFRLLSWNEIGSAAMMSRAIGGLALLPSSPSEETPNANPDETGTFIFALPGSINAVTLALEKLIAPQLPHLVWERKR